MAMKVRSALVWLALALAVTVPVIAAAYSPLLAWREPVYIAAGFAGILALCLLLFQPLLAIGILPGLNRANGRRVHPILGMGLIAAVLIHVGGLWITSPPDVVDALLFASPTPFSIWGVTAMWALFAAAAVALLRRKLKLRWSTTRRTHLTLTATVIAGSVAHTLLIEGTMELASKIVLCCLVVLAAGYASLKSLR